MQPHHTTLSACHTNHLIPCRNLPLAIVHYRRPIWTLQLQLRKMFHRLGTFDATALHCH